MNKNDWLVTWNINDNDNIYCFKEECQYIANVIMLLQQEVLSNQNLLDIKIEPMNSDSNLKGLA